jgi:lipid II:glycine glycyltransferase (peptidoglycan interpeptide bridge formation enzyme)
MICIVEEKEIEEIKPTNVLPQTSFWANVKNRQGFEPSGFEINVSKDLLDPESNTAKKINDDLLVLIKYVNHTQCFAYVPYGPKIEPDFENYGLFLEELSEVLRPHLPPECIMIRYDLPWENQWAAEEDFYDQTGSWTGPPPPDTQEFRLNFKTNNWNLHKSPSDILPTNTFFLNLNLREEELLNRMKPKTRYNIRLSFRKGVNVNSYGMEKLDEWYRLYRMTAMRNSLTLHRKDYFTSILASRQSLEKDVKVNLLMADYNGEYLAAMFLIHSRKRGTYLYGASSSEKRHLMATYAVQWEAIRQSQRHGCTEYDMFGASPNCEPSHPLYGLFRYKRGFGGRLYHRMGCWDYPLIENDYKILKASEVNNQRYHV